MRFLIGAFAIALSFGVAKAEPVGRWCSQPVPGYVATDSAVTLERAEDGTGYVTHEFRSSRLERAIEVRSDTLFFVLDEDTGYRVLGDGSLEIFDDDGVIETARAVGLDAPAERCWR